MSPALGITNSNHRAAIYGSMRQAGLSTNNSQQTPAPIGTTLETKALLLFLSITACSCGGSDSGGMRVPVLRIETSIHCIDQLRNGFLENATNVALNETFLGSELIVKA